MVIIFFEFAAALIRTYVCVYIYIYIYRDTNVCMSYKNLCKPCQILFKVLWNPQSVYYHHHLTKFKHKK